MRTKATVGRREYLKKAPQATAVVALCQGTPLDTAKRLANVTGAIFLCKRGGKQLGEASADPSKGHARNLLGLLPFGALYDDPGESIGDAWKRCKNLPFWHKVGEIFTF